MSFRFLFFKPVIVLGFFFSLLGITGCFGDSSKEETSSSSYQTYEGEIQSLGNVKFSGEATHLFRMEDGTVIYLYSDKYDLDATEYRGELIRLSGFVAPVNENEDKPVMNVDRIEPVSKEEENKGPVTLKVYSNSEMGFAMEYSSDWNVETAGGLITFKAPAQEEATSKDKVTVKVVLNNENLPLEEWFKVYEDDPVDPVSYEPSAIGPKQIPALKVEEKRSVDAANGATFYIHDAERIFVVTIVSIEEEKRAEHARIFSEMLYSFDLLSDGSDLIATDEFALDGSDAESSDVAEYQAVAEAIAPSLKALASSFDPVTAMRYEFVESEYVYVTYRNDFNEDEGRILVRRLSGNQFETVAFFQPGATTDWELVSGADEAKGKPKVLFNPISNIAVPIEEGYRLFESSTYGFQIQYPSAWYYARSQNFFYFNDKPIDELKGLVSLEVLASDAVSPEVDQPLIASRKMEDGTWFKFYGSPEYEELAKFMAESVIQEN